MVMDDTIRVLWEAWILDRRPVDRELLVVHYLPLVDQVSGAMAAKLPSSVEREDIAGYGALGLIDAVDKFDLNVGAPFEGYAQIRIKGAIVDGIRGVAWEPRSVRTRAREVARARADLEQRHGRSVTNTEIAVELHVHVDDVERALTDMRDAAAATWLAPEISDIAAPRSDASPFPVDIGEMSIALAEAIVALPDRERVVFTLYYGIGFKPDEEPLTLGAIGELLGVSSSGVRVNQILNDAIAAIQRSMAGRKP